MFSKRNHLSYHFPITIHLHLASFYAQNTFKKIAGEMFIEQIIEFQLRGPWPTCTPITGHLHDKTKIFKENLRVDNYLLLIYCRRQCALLPPTWTKSLTIKILDHSATF